MDKMLGGNLHGVVVPKAQEGALEVLRGVGGKTHGDSAKSAN
jgi:hypothetical protein